MLLSGCTPARTGMQHSPLGVRGRHLDLGERGVAVALAVGHGRRQDAEQHQHPVRAGAHRSSSMLRTLAAAATRLVMP